MYILILHTYFPMKKWGNRGASWSCELSFPTTKIGDRYWISAKKNGGHRIDFIGQRMGFLQIGFKSPKFWIWHDFLDMVWHHFMGWNRKDMGSQGADPLTQTQKLPIFGTNWTHSCHVKPCSIGDPKNGSSTAAKAAAHTRWSNMAMEHDQT